MPGSPSRTHGTRFEQYRRIKESLSERLLQAGIPVRTVRKLLRTRIHPKKGGKKAAKRPPSNTSLQPQDLERAGLLIAAGRLALDRAVKLFNIPPDALDRILQDLSL